jgi:hypothetical protein
VEKNFSYSYTVNQYVKLYKEFESVIEATYARLDGSQGQSVNLVLDLPELESWLITRFRELGFELDRYSDFFSSGVDSLKAIQIRGLIIQSLDLGVNRASLSSMLVYDCGNIMRLSQKLFGLRVGSEGKTYDELNLMGDMIEQYSVLPKRQSQPPRVPHPDEKVVVSVPKLKFWQNGNTQLLGNCLTYVIYPGSHRRYWIFGNSSPLRPCLQPSYRQNLLPDQSNEHSKCFPASWFGFKKPLFSPSHRLTKSLVPSR